MVLAVIISGIFTTHLLACDWYKEAVAFEVATRRIVGFLCAQSAVENDVAGESLLTGIALTTTLRTLRISKSGGNS